MTHCRKNGSYKETMSISVEPLEVPGEPQESQELPKELPKDPPEKPPEEPPTPAPKKRGRPVGAKDSRPRTRRKPEEIDRPVPILMPAHVPRPPTQQELADIEDLAMLRSLRAFNQARQSRKANLYASWFNR